MSIQTTTTTAPIFSKICRIPDLLADATPVMSLYADNEQVLHMQCRLQNSGHLVLFPVTFRMVNRYLSGDYTLAELVSSSPCENILLVTRGHNLLELSKATFDAGCLQFATKYYPDILCCKTASIDDIRRGLHACMRG